MSLVKVGPNRSDTGDSTTASSGGKRRGAAPTVAMSPRANLMPPEIGVTNRRRAARRGMRVVVGIAVVLTGLGIAGAWQIAAASQSQLASAQRQTQVLSGDTAKYAKISSTIAGISQGKAAREVGGSTDVDWSAYLTKLQGTLPAGVTLKTVAVKSADVTSTFGQSTVPLEGSRVGTITFTADSPSIPSIPTWVNGLSTLPGFADASPDSVTKQDDGTYEAQVTMHVNAKAFSHRFDSTKGGSK